MYKRINSHVMLGHKHSRVGKIHGGDRTDSGWGVGSTVSRVIVCCPPGGVGCRWRVKEMCAAVSTELYGEVASVLK